MRILKRIIHPFILNLNFAFNDVNNCYLVTEYLKGGDLEYHFNRGINYTEKQAQFIIACLILAVEFLHNNAVIHKDICPANVFFDELGYAKLADFGIS